MEAFSSHFPVLVPILAAMSATFASVYSAFARFDSDQSDENRRFVRDWILGVRVDSQRWQVFYVELFGRFFGHRHLSVKCISRSVLLSIILICSTYFVSSYLPLHNKFDILSTRFVQLAMLSIVVACITDYFSLWKTRILMTKTNLYARLSSTVFIVLADIVLTTLLFFLFNIVGFAIWFHLVNPRYDALFAGYVQIVYSFRTSKMVPVENLYFVSLLTSSWLWAYVLGTSGARATPSVIKVLAQIQDFENHPVRTMGYLAATLCATGVATVLMIWAY